MKKLPKAGILSSPMERFRKKSSLMAKVTGAFLVLIFCAFQVNAQQHQVTGTVTDIDGVSLPGVNVLVEGTMIGTTTDPDGRYSIEAPSPTSILAVSYVGYTRETIAIEGRSVIDITLVPEFRAIDEIVVVGYGTRLREELTGSVSTVNESQLAATTSSNVIGRLQGQVAGVTVTSSNMPGGGTDIAVRGIGTINNSSPLYIIDGVPTGPSNTINSNDIESISILKDASSAAIYGTRGANGVVIITTKQGKAGQKPTVRFNARTGMAQATNQYDLLNAEEYGELLWLEAKNRGVAPSNALYGSGAEPRIPDYILPAGAMEGDPGVNPDLYRYPNYLIQEANKVGTNWYDEIYQSGIQSEYDMSISGGSENTTYAFSGGYLNEEGILMNTGFDRFTFRSNVDSRFTSWFKAGQSLIISRAQTHGNRSDNNEGSVVSQAYRSQPIIPVRDIMGNYAGSRAPTLGNSANPVAVLDRDKNNYGRNVRILGSFYGEGQLMEGMVLRTSLGYNYAQHNGRTLTFANPEHSEPQTLDALRQTSNESFQWNWSNTLNYTTTIADIHRVNVILGTEAIQNQYEEMNAGRSQYFSTDLNYMRLNSGEINQLNDGYGSEWSLFSIFGRVNYDLMGRYLFEATVRRDGSSRFGADNRYGTFPAASVAWAVSQEDFMEGTRNWLDFMKIRLGWGISGNDQIGNYDVYNTYNTHPNLSHADMTGSNTSVLTGFRPGQFGNPNVSWETTEMVNLGLDLAFLQNRFNLGVDVFQRNTTDMLYQIEDPVVVGVPATRPYVNIGEMKNTGFDLELGYNNTSANGLFRYGANLTVSHYKNEIVKLSGNPDERIPAGSLRQMSYTSFEVGTAYPEFYGYTVDGIFQTQAEADAHATAFGASGEYNQPGRFKYRDANNDGVIDANDMDYIGSPHPDFVGGLNINLGYSNFDLSMFFYGSYGNDVVNYVRRWIDYTQFLGNRSHDRLYNSWGSPYLANNADAKLPIADLDAGSQQPSTHFVEDGSFLRLKNLRLTYSIPQTFLNRYGIQGLSIYGQGTNLFTLTNYSGLDPELHETEARERGLDQGAWPTARQLMIGVSLTL